MDHPERAGDACRLAIFLIGPRGSGKTTVARLLAARLGWKWIDADAELERRCGRSIRAVRETDNTDNGNSHKSGGQSCSDPQHCTEHGCDPEYLDRCRP